MKQAAKGLTAAQRASARKSARRLIPVRFEFTAPEAISVSVAGGGNNWHPTTKFTRPVGSSDWDLEALLAPGDYEYCLVGDGHWMPDPKVRDRMPTRLAARTHFTRGGIYRGSAS
jgi:1,4-alpha-glucan branching enzyme